MFVAVTVTPGTTAPDESLTTPEISARSNCAHAGAAISTPSRTHRPSAKRRPPSACSTEASWFPPAPDTPAGAENFPRTRSRIPGVHRQDARPRLDLPNRSGARPSMKYCWGRSPCHWTFTGSCRIPGRPWLRARVSAVPTSCDSRAGLNAAMSHRGEIRPISATKQGFSPPCFRHGPPRLTWVERANRRPALCAFAPTLLRHRDAAQRAESGKAGAAGLKPRPPGAQPRARSSGASIRRRGPEPRHPHSAEALCHI